MTVTGSRIVRADGYQAEQNGELYLVVDNLFNRDSPLSAGGLSSGFYQGPPNSLFYDRRRREFALGVRLKL